MTQFWMDSSPPRGKSRWEERLEEIRQARQAELTGVDKSVASYGYAWSTSHVPHLTIGDYVGLCLLIDFDVPASTSILPGEVWRFCNERHYTGFGNNGSVYDYFYDNSKGKLRYTNIVPLQYYRAAHPRDHYTDPNRPARENAIELIREALDKLKSEGFKFDQLSTDDEGFVYALNVFYAGPCTSNWLKGLWPHRSSFDPPYYKLMDGMWVRDYQITNMASRDSTGAVIDDELTLGTFCHENGHMLCNFPDLYDYDQKLDSFGRKVPESQAAGYYCLMGAGDLADPKNPTRICAYLKYMAGWATIKPLTPGHHEISADKHEFFIYQKPAGQLELPDPTDPDLPKPIDPNNPIGPDDPPEYFLIENRYQEGRDSALPDSGLAIWHIDEDYRFADMNYQEGRRQRHYVCALIQADRQLDLEKGEGYGDDTDLFSADNKNQFDASHPGNKWWDGTPTKLKIFNISDAKPKMEFDVEVYRLYEVSADGDGLHLRKGPGTDYTSITVMSDGKRVYGGKERNGWIEIDLEGDGKIVGWACRAYLDPIDESE